MRRLGDLTWRDVEALPRDRTVAILPVGSTEAHGPHLPLATDVIIAEAMAREGAARLEEQGIEAVLLPSILYSVAEYAAPFPGTVSLRGGTATAVVADIAASLQAQGFRFLALANAHLEPAHIASLRAAAATAAACGLAVVFPDVTRKPWALRLSDEFKSGACHAGQYEGSIVLAERPDLVRDGVRRGLPPNLVSLSRAIRDGKRTFVEAGGPAAYFGDPAAASAEEGRRTVAELGAILAEAVRDAMRATG